MSTREMDPVFTAALRDVLTAQTRHNPRVRRLATWRWGVGVVASVTFAAGGVALASGLFSPPGTTVDTPLGNVVSATRTGSATISLGTPPALATGVSLTVTCLSAGTFGFPDGSSASCDAADMSRPARLRQVIEVVSLRPGQDTVTISAAPADASWELQALYVHRSTTPWGVNARGETFGVQNQHGTPNLIAVAIDQGQSQGYITASDLNCADGADATSPAQALAWSAQNRRIAIPVYESDGTTVIGSFIVGGASNSKVPPVPLSSLRLGC